MKKHLLILVLCVAALCIFGVVMLYSTAFKHDDAVRFRAQLNWLGAGLVLLPVLVRVDYAWLNRRPVLYALAGVCLLFLVAVFIPGIGVHTNGASRWIRGLGQPSEFAKPVVIVLLATWLARLGEGLRIVARGHKLQSCAETSGDRAFMGDPLRPGTKARSAAAARRSSDCPEPGRDGAAPVRHRPNRVA